MHKTLITQQLKFFGCRSIYMYLLNHYAQFKIRKFYSYIHVANNIILVRLVKTTQSQCYFVKPVFKRICEEFPVVLSLKWPILIHEIYYLISLYNTNNKQLLQSGYHNHCMRLYMCVLLLLLVIGLQWLHPQNNSTP